ncbi:MAG: septal ring lytic transglycosylase RlpA family protein [Hyphomicrobium sp.]
MRTILNSVALAIATMLLAAAPASAATWQCQGPSYVCDAGSSSAKAGKVSKSGNKAASYKSKKQARVSSYTGASSISGKASYYWQPQRVASGGWFNPNAMTAAHKTLPFGTKVRVTNAHNGKSVVVTINDRGPYVAGRVIDLSKAAAHAISMQGSGVVPVQVTVLGRG